MIKISKQVDYSLQLLLALSRQKKANHLSLKQFSGDSSISFLFLQKIVRALRRAGIVAATKGAHGGYYLPRSLTRLTLKDVMEAVDGNIGPTACTRGDKCSKEGRCQIENGVKSIQKKMLDLLGDVRVVDMMNEKKVI